MEPGRLAQTGRIGDDDADAVNSPDPSFGVSDSVHLPKFLMQAIAACGVDVRQLAGECQIPGWALTAEQGMISSEYAMRIWELAEWALQDPGVPLAVAARDRRGALSLFDYLFATAPDLAAGYEANARYLHLVTTNTRLEVSAETEREVTYSFRYIQRERRGAELSTQFALAIFCARAREATGKPVAPVRATFAQPPPGSYRPLAEALGTPNVDFDHPANTVTFRRSDLRSPLRDADPPLAAILRRYAATLPPPAPVTWYGQLRLLLEDRLAEGISLQIAARQLAMSPRSLQRYLAGQGTTWRAELDQARLRRASRRPASGGRDATLARELGYSEARSARRALARLNAADRR